MNIDNLIEESRLRRLASEDERAIERAKMTSTWQDFARLTQRLTIDDPGTVVNTVYDAPLSSDIAHDTSITDDAAPKTTSIEEQYISALHDNGPDAMGLINTGKVDLERNNGALMIETVRVRPAIALWYLTKTSNVESFMRDDLRVLSLVLTIYETDNTKLMSVLMEEDKKHRDIAHSVSYLYVFRKSLEAGNILMMETIADNANYDTALLADVLEVDTRNPEYIDKASYTPDMLETYAAATKRLSPNVLTAFASYRLLRSSSDKEMFVNMMAFDRPSLFMSFVVNLDASFDAFYRYAIYKVSTSDAGDFLPHIVAAAGRLSSDHRNTLLENIRYDAAKDYYAEHDPGMLKSLEIIEGSWDQTWLEEPALSETLSAMAIIIYSVLGDMVVDVGVNELIDTMMNITGSDLYAMKGDSLSDLVWKVCHAILRRFSGHLNENEYELVDNMIQEGT